MLRLLSVCGGVRISRCWPMHRDLLCAIAELRLLGVAVDHDCEVRVRRSVDHLADEVLLQTAR